MIDAARASRLYFDCDSRAPTVRGVAAGISRRRV